MIHHDNDPTVPPSVQPAQVHLTVTLPAGSVMIPSWLAICFVICFVLSSFTLLMVWTANSKLVGEIRVLQIYEEDVENVLIRSGIATRQDFVPRTNPRPLTQSPNAK